MDKKLFKDLFTINLIEAYPQIISKLKKSGKRYDSNKLLKTILYRNMVFGSLIILLIYGVLLGSIPYKSFPIILDLFLMYILIFNILTSFIPMINSISLDKSITFYKSLPINPRKIFLVKFMAIALWSFISNIIFFALFGSFFLQLFGLSFIGIIKGIIMAIILGLIFSLLSIGLSGILAILLSRLSMFNRHSKTILNIVILLSTFMNIAFILFIQNYLSKNIQNFNFKFNSIFAARFFDFKEGLIATLLLIIITIIIYVIIIRFNTFETYYLKENIKTNTQKRRSNKSKIKLPFFIYYNLRLIAENSTIIYQTLIAPVLLVFILIAPFFSKFRDLSQIIEGNYIYQLALALSIFLIPLFYSNINYGTSINYMFLSLEKENFLFIKTLPISLNKYILKKSIIGTVISSIMPLIGLIVFSVLFKINISVVLISIVINSIYAVVSGISAIYYDYAHLYTSWTNATELLMRVSTGLRSLINIIMLIILSALLYIGIYLIMYGSTYFISIYIIVMYVLAFTISLCQLFYYKNKIKY